jgi:phospholipase C
VEAHIFIFLRFAAHISKDLTMTQLDRRKFMKMMGVTAAGTAGLSTLPPAIQQALAIAPNRATGTIKDVEHVVILMQENRSFDHYFGTYNGVRGYTDPRPVRRYNTPSVLLQPNSRHISHANRCGTKKEDAVIAPFHIDYGKTGEDIRSTCHTIASGIKAWNQGNYDKWIEAKGDVFVMGYLKHQEVSYHRSLANSFTICDHYFSSVHGNTQPNRLYHVSGTASDPKEKDPKKAFKSDVDLLQCAEGMTWDSYPERIEKHNKTSPIPVSWCVYHGGLGDDKYTDNFACNTFEYFEGFRKEAPKGGVWMAGKCVPKNYVAPAIELANSVFGLQIPVAEIKYDPKKLGNLTKKGLVRRTIKQLALDVREDKLPNISWIAAPHHYIEHSKGTSEGAFYINEVLKALVSNEKVWSKTVFIINYDENDGFFDHIVPPMPPVDTSDGLVSEGLEEGLDHEMNGHPIGFGPRVPCLVISPWSKGGRVCSQVFDHTSVLQFLEKRFGIEETNISKWRRAVAGDLTSALNFGEADAGTSDLGFLKTHKFAPRGPKKGKGQNPRARSDYMLPVAEDPASLFAHKTSNPDGTRRACPLPYDFTVTGTIDVEKRQLNLTMKNNSPEAGVHFYVFNNLDQSPGSKPRRFTIGKTGVFVKNRELSTELKRGFPIREFTSVNLLHYDYSVYGPNGYLAEFKGSTDGAIDGILSVVPQQVAKDADLLLLNIKGIDKLKNRYLKITSKYQKVQQPDALLGDSGLAPLLENATAMLWPIRTRHGWYDVTVEIANEKGEVVGKYMRRYAGHLENGKESRTDPFLTEKGMEPPGIQYL